MRDGAGPTCSLPSSLRASFTLPMLPAPIVLPKIHLPDWVGMVVRDLVCLAAGGGASAWPWAAPWEATEGLPLLGTAEGGMSGWPCCGGGW